MEQIIASHLMTAPAIEQEMVQDDRRGVSDLVPHLPPDFVQRAARSLLQSEGTVLIATGFYVGGAAETDGPPGAIALGNALKRLGRPVVYVTDRYAAPLMNALAHPAALVIEVPIIDQEASKALCRRIIDESHVGLAVAIERCGQTSDGRYLNMHGVDISVYTARLDYLFDDVPSIGIGDGGNEIGMGLVYEAVRTSKRLVTEPTVTATDDLIVSSVSNWGAYGLVAALSNEVDMDLLPTLAEAREAITTIVGLGAVNGVSGKPEFAVDGFTLDENLEKLERLRSLLA
jgi:hypothetical protein